MIKYLSKDDDFNSLIKSRVLVDFYADWCGPCKMMGTLLEELDDSVNVLKVNTDEFNDLALSYGIMTIPTLILMEDGKEIKKHIGLMSKSDLDKFVESI